MSKILPPLPFLRALWEQNDLFHYIRNIISISLISVLSLLIIFIFDFLILLKISFISQIESYGSLYQGTSTPTTKYQHFFSKDKEIIKSKWIRARIKPQAETSLHQRSKISMSWNLLAQKEKMGTKIQGTNYLEQLQLIPPVKSRNIHVICISRS